MLEFRKLQRQVLREILKSQRPSILKSQRPSILKSQRPSISAIYRQTLTEGTFENLCHVAQPRVQHLRVHVEHCPQL